VDLAYPTTPVSGGAGVGEISSVDGFPDLRGRSTVPAGLATPAPSCHDLDADEGAVGSVPVLGEQMPMFSREATVTHLNLLQIQVDTGRFRVAV
jgi:hypothetical protein